jgi:hypothetical protein
MFCGIMQEKGKDLPVHAMKAYRQSQASLS